MAKLKAKPELFCREYIVDLNVTQAAIRAGYSAKTAYSSGQRLFKEEVVQQRINELKQDRINQLGVDANYVLLRLVEIDRMDAADIFNKDMSIKPIREWPQVWRRYISGFDVSELFEGKEMVGILKKIKWPDKVRNLELLGKHIAVQAFKENIRNEVTGANGGPMQISNLSPDEAAEAYRKMME